MGRPALPGCAEDRLAGVRWKEFSEPQCAGKFSGHEPQSGESLSWCEQCVPFKIKAMHLRLRAQWPMSGREPRSGRCLTGHAPWRNHAAERALAQSCRGAGA
jgi:hypothetical protein